MAKLNILVVTLPDQVLHQLDQGHDETLCAIFQNASLVQIASVYLGLWNKSNRNTHMFKLSPNTQELKCTVQSSQFLFIWHTMSTFR